MQVQMDAIDPKARVFLLTNGDILITSSLTWEDLPLPRPLQSKPEDDWRYARDARRYGKCLAKHFWRQREGRSNYAGVRVCMLAQFNAMFPWWKRWWWNTVDWALGG